MGDVKRNVKNNSYIHLSEIVGCVTVSHIGFYMSRYGYDMIGAPMIPFHRQNVLTF